MRIQEEISGDVRILRLVGDLDVPEAREVAKRLDAAGGRVRLVLNLSGVGFASAAAFGTFVRAWAKARKQQGEVVVSAPSRFVRTTLKMVGLDGHVRVFPDDESALRHLRARPGAKAAGGCGLFIALC
jgi:anti-anti-sigma factor